MVIPVQIFRACLVKWLLSVIAISVFGLGASIAQTELETPMTRAELTAAMQEGGLVLFMRHERTEVPSRSDDYNQPTNCQVQRNLSIAGAAGSQETGIVLRAAESDISRIITSPMCRAAETARFMFGTDYEIDMRLMHHDPNGERNMDVAIAEAKALLAELAPVEAGSNIMLIGHGGTVRWISGLSLSEGGIAVLRLSDDGAVTTLGSFRGSDLASLARRNLAASE